MDIAMSRWLLLLILFLPLRAAAQSEDDPCGFSLRKPGETAVWAYGTDALIADLQGWALHPMTHIDVIGNSTQGRPLYHVVITNPASQLPKKRIWIHARTHPIESESSFVARAIVEELLGGSILGNLILDHAVVHILPMLNPDGVALQNARENARGVDLESNWNAAAPEAEVQALRRHLSALMQSSTPIDVALNLHSAYNCKRYFVYHAAAGTSVLFTQLEQQFIGFARDRFPGGIEPHDYFVSWTSGTPDRYPESWFWLNYREAVMALTYEDMNCTAAGDYDRTARALLGAAGDYLGLTGVLGVDRMTAGSESPLLVEVFPNPVHAGGSITVRLAAEQAGKPLRVGLYDRLGREVVTVFDGEGPAAEHTLRIATGNLSPGTYYLRATGRDVQRTHPVLLLR